MPKGDRTGPMGAKRFWDLIAWSARPTRAEQNEALRVGLARLPAEDIVGFDLRLWDYLGQGNKVDLWAALWLICGGCSDDGFLYCRCWLIARGKQVYEVALANPDKLIDFADSFEPGRLVYGFEDLLRAAASGWDEGMGEFDDARSAAEDFRHPELDGEMWKFGDRVEMRRRFPRLAGRYLGPVAE